MGFKGLRKYKLVCRSARGAGFNWRALEFEHLWKDMVGRGFSTRSSDPSFLKGFLLFKFWLCLGPLIWGGDRGSE